MQRRPRRWMEAYTKRHSRRQIWKKIVQAMACIVVFCTTYALILPAITMEQQYTCGLEEHTHTDACYSQQPLTEINCSLQSLQVHSHSESCLDAAGVQVCGCLDLVLHTHESVCYDSQGTLVCPLPEAEAHAHGDACFESGVLTCTLTELQSHTHSDACRDGDGNLICAQQEVLSHQHTQGCILEVSQRSVMTCSQEEHTHTETCLSDPEADTETAEDWEKSFAQTQLGDHWQENLLVIARTQLGYEESSVNYISEDGQTRQGYTRYGAWYGTPYGKWDAMFVSFCLHYAGIPQEAISRESDSAIWQQLLGEAGLLNDASQREPQIGEPVFYSIYNGTAVRVGIVYAIDRHTNPETGTQEIAQLRIIAGDAENRVAELSIPMTDVLNTCSLERARLNYEAQYPAEQAEPEQTLPDETTVPTETIETTELTETTAFTEPTESTEPAETTEDAQIASLVTQTAETENYIVTVSYSTDLELPEGTELRVVEYSKDSDIFRQRCEQAGYELEWLMNIGFFLGDTELDLEGQFNVVVTSKQGLSLGSDITHFDGQTPEQITGTAQEEDTVTFTADGFSDFGGAALAETRAAAVTYQFTTANPASLQEGVDYVVYFGNNNNYTFLTTTNYIDARQVNGAQYWSSPYIIGNSWELSADQMGTANLSHIAWRIVKDGQYYYLQSQKDNQRIVIENSLWMGGGSWLKNVDTNGAGTKLEAEWYGSINYLRYDNGWTRTNSRNNATVMYFARVTQTGNTSNVPSYPYHPHAVHTGEVNISRLRFFNICENGDSGVSALPGCVFEITDANGNVYATVTSGESPEVSLPEGMPNGTYTIQEVSAPDGYMRDTNHTRTFTIQDGTLVSDRNIGTFINHDMEQLTANKTSEVEDYNNRIYQILLEAESHMRHYQMDPVDVLFVVDQSNSMLFPSGLEETGKQVTLRLDGTNNASNMEALNLDKNQMYYIISDPTGTSTVWAVWYNGQGWMFQDASYYAKAKHENKAGYEDPDYTVIFPEYRSYNDQKSAEASGTRSNGGGLGFNLSGGGLGNYINTLGGTGTFKIYTATGEYNRLHYLEESLANMIYELADVNSQNRVTLTGFTKEIQYDKGPLELTPDNVTTLVNAVTSIQTGGGTRQDIALKHVYENHLNDASENYSDNPLYNYTILITDGAPVLSGGSVLKNLGSPNDAATTTGDTVYGQIKGYAELVRSKSSLMTVGLGMDDVEAGKDVLEQIASGGDFFCALDDASALVQNIQKMLFDAFRPKGLIPMTGDVVDEISDSFYPIAWTNAGAGAATGHQVLVQGTDKDWILLNSGDWITLEGRYTTAGASDAAGQLLQKDDGTFYIQWNHVQLSYPDKEHPHKNIAPVGVAWVAEGRGSSTGRTVIGTYGGKDWIQLNEGDWITQQGQYYSGTPSYYQQWSHGQYKSGSISWGRSANGNNRVLFDYTQVPFNADGGQWEGTFYVKAKEDFIGGNAIDTNKSAHVTADHAEKALPTPTVNVRLLDMNEMSSEVTVYLGDTINPIYGTDADGNVITVGESPLDSLKLFYEGTRFFKLISDGGDVLNKVTAASSDIDGLEEAIFYLRYAMGRDLTADEWSKLVEGESITVEYTYDYASSHGAVGYFTFSLEKTGIEGANPDYAAHEATAACQPKGTPLTQNCEAAAEVYTLNVTYTAYELGQAGRPATNVYNDAAGPGTEVGTGATLETGLGTVKKENVHEVHVISGSIEVTKMFAEGITPETDQTFYFTVHRVEDGEDTSADIVKSVTLRTGSATVSFDGLRRGTYVLTENPHDAYMVDTMTVRSTTNCESAPAIGARARSITFVMGNNVGAENVIGLAAEDDRYSSYIDPVNGVFGAALVVNKEIVYTGEVPVVKVWNDGTEPHGEDAVYVLLYLDGVPVVDGAGNGRLLMLDASNNWQGSFEVTLKDEKDKVSNYHYSVKEVSMVSTSEMFQWKTAVLQNNGALIYYEKALESNGLIGVNGHGYMVEYGTDENGTLVVRNNRTVDLPSTGDSGTQMYTISGLFLLMTALMYGCSQRRKRERGASQ